MAIKKTGFGAVCSENSDNFEGVRLRHSLPRTPPNPLSVKKVQGPGKQSRRVHPEHPLRVAWQREQRIGWAESRVRDRMRRELRLNWNTGRVVNLAEGCLPSKIPERRDLEIYLAMERDCLSYRQIAMNFFGTKDSRTVAKVCRAIQHIKKQHPGWHGRPVEPRGLLTGFEAGQARSVGMRAKGSPGRSQ